MLGCSVFLIWLILVVLTIEVFKLGHNEILVWLANGCLPFVNEVLTSLFCLDELLDVRDQVGTLKVVRL